MTATDDEVEVSVSADDGGRFALRDLTPGNYTLRIELQPGSHGYTTQSATVSEGATTRVDVELSP